MKKLLVIGLVLITCSILGQPEMSDGERIGQQLDRVGVFINKVRDQLPNISKLPLQDQNRFLDTRMTTVRQLFEEMKGNLGGEQLDVEYINGALAGLEQIANELQASKMAQPQRKYKPGQRARGPRGRTPEQPMGCKRLPPNRIPPPECR